MERADFERWSAKEVARLLALMESGRRYYQQIVAVAPVGVLVVSSELSLVMANRRFREIFNLRGEDLSQRTLEQILPIEGFRKRVVEVLTTGNPQRAVLCELPGPDGPRTIRMDLLLPHTWDDDKETEVLVFAQEVTPYARPAPVVKQAALPDVPVIFWEADAENGQFTFVSPNAEKLLGYPAEKWLSEPSFFPGRIHADDRPWMLDLYRATIAAGTDKKCEYRGVAASGAVLWLQETIHPVRHEDGRVVKLAGVTFDNTEQHQLQEQITDARKMEALARLASRIGHDFNNLLMIVAGYGEELANGLDPKDPLRAELDEILKASQRASEITSQLLAFSRRIAARPEVLDLNRLLNQVAESLRATLPPNVRLDTTLAAETLPVEADPGHLRQVITDVVGYARASMPEGGAITIETRPVKLGEQGDFAMVAVTDTGRGLDEETRTRLFEPFSVFEAGKEPNLGLSTAYRLVRQNGGQISVHSEPGRGATFRIYLPKVAAEPKQDGPVTPPVLEEEPAPVAAPEPKAEPAAETRTVLVVEDEDGVRTLMHKILHRQGYQVLQAANGIEALDLVLSHRGAIDLLVTDVVMPEMGGRALAEQLKLVRPEIRVLYVSGFTDDAVIQSGLLPRGTAFLQKPFTLASLLGKVRETLVS